MLYIIMDSTSDFDPNKNNGPYTAFPLGFLKLHIFFTPVSPVTCHLILALRVCTNICTIANYFAYSISTSLGFLTNVNCIFFYTCIPSDLSFDTSSESVYKHICTIANYFAYSIKKCVKYVIFYASRTCAYSMTLKRTLRSSLEVWIYLWVPQAVLVTWR